MPGKALEFSVCLVCRRGVECGEGFRGDDGFGRGGVWSVADGGR